MTNSPLPTLSKVIESTLASLIPLTPPERLTLARFSRKGAVQRLRASRFNTIHYENAADELALIDEIIENGERDDDES